MFECEKCGSATRAMLMMQVSAPPEMLHYFSKKNMRSKDFHILGVLWETADYICTNESCRHITNGYGNYVTNLKKENERLKKILEEEYERGRITNYKDDTPSIIKELKEQATVLIDEGWGCSSLEFDEEKFAELLLKFVMLYVTQYTIQNGYCVKCLE
jgi:hypothetical protein